MIARVPVRRIGKAERALEFLFALVFVLLAVGDPACGNAVFDSLGELSL